MLLGQGVLKGHCHAIAVSLQRAKTCQPKNNALVFCQGLYYCTEYFTVICCYGWRGLEWIETSKKLANLFKFSSCVLKKSQANCYGFLSLLNFIRYLRSYAGAFLVQLKVLRYFSIMTNPEAPLCLKQKFSFLSTTRTTRITRGTTSHNLVIPQPRTNLGKRTSYSATLLFNALEVDLKILAVHPLASPSALSSFSFSLKHKLCGLFLQNLNTVSHLEELCCHECCFLLKCRCFFLVCDYFMFLSLLLLLLIV